VRVSVESRTLGGAGELASNAANRAEKVLQEVEQQAACPKLVASLQGKQGFGPARARLSGKGVKKETHAFANLTEDCPYG
jgi:hypothetical protein